MLFEPVGAEDRRHKHLLIVLQRTIVEEGSIARCVGVAVRIDLDKLQLARDGATLAGGIGTGILDGVVKVEKDAHILAAISGIDQNGTSLEQVLVAVKYQADGRIQQWVAGADKGSLWLAVHMDQLFLEDDPFIAMVDRRARVQGHAADTGRDVLDLIASRLALKGTVAKPL